MSIWGVTLPVESEGFEYFNECCEYLYPYHNRPSNRNAKK